MKLLSSKPKLERDFFFFKKTEQKKLMADDHGLDGGDAVPEILDLHSTLPTQVGVVGSREEIINPKTTLDTSGVIHFEIASSQNEMIDVCNTMILIESKIVNADGTDVTDAAGGGDVNANNKVIPVNGLSHAWMKGCEVKLNGTQIAPNDGNYSTRADLDIRLAYPKETKTGSLELSGFDEEHTAFESLADGDIGWDDPPASAHPQLMRRWVGSKNSKTIHTIGHIHSEIFDQPKPLPPGTRLSLYFTKQHKNEMLFLTKLAAKDFKMLMLRCRLVARIITVDPDILNEMNHISSMGRPMQYPIRRVEVTVATKPAYVHSKRRQHFASTCIHRVYETDGILWRQRKQSFQLSSRQHTPGVSVSWRTDPSLRRDHLQR